jgi:hypothetical protein
MTIQTFKKASFVGLFSYRQCARITVGNEKERFSSSLAWLVEKLRASDTFTCGDRSSGR